MPANRFICCSFSASLALSVTSCCWASLSCSRRSLSKRVISPLAASSRTWRCDPPALLGSLKGGGSGTEGIAGGLLVLTDDGEVERCLERDLELDLDRSRSFTLEHNKRPISCTVRVDAGGKISFLIIYFGHRCSVERRRGWK